ncbi:mas-related G-protein coupled receptor member H-like [Lacerta agilis]|uniref:mas-related G-protein coupled receptor member H-like n=1 Tax=Lacerta agilis TaxID=80427 RepID=UPI001419D89E|nr:mas-related G-protein coupled receptor member H-like [Lacerta agilis]
MSNHSLGSWSSLNASWEDIGAENGTDLLNPQDGFDHESSLYPTAYIILLVLILVISIFGLMGNGTVIWFLGFCMKRNPFTIFILHLAVADLGTLMCLCSLMIIFVHVFFMFMYNTGQYLLTAISMDRCVSVVFPLWHRCHRLSPHRPPHFSTLVCATIWIFSFLLTVICWILPNFLLIKDALFYHLLVNAILCLPLMTVSTLVLFIKVYFRSQQRKRGKAVRAILLALLFFLILAFPFTCILLIFLSSNFVNYNAIFIGPLCSCLNSSVNPLIYFLVGRKKHSRSRESLKVIFQRVFKEEEDGRKKGDIQVRTQF